MAVAVSPHKVQRLMRHSSVAVLTRFYAHLTVEDLRAAVDAHTPLLASAFAQFAPPAPQAEKQAQAVAAAGARNHSDNEEKDWCVLLESNQRPPPCQGGVLPLN